jgi:DNA-directed RNA polymerase II subunit RPB7
MRGKLTNPIKLIPQEIRWDPNATPPQFTNNEDTTIEVGTHVRVKILGTRAEVGELWAIGSIKEDYLGYEPPCSSIYLRLLS